MTALDLTSVSSQVRLWTLPIIYHTVILKTAKDITRFSRSVVGCGTIQSEPLPLYVKNLGVFALGPLTTIRDIIVSCANAQNAAYGFSLAGYVHVLGNTSQTLPAASPIEHHFLSQSAREGLDIPFINPKSTHLHVQLSTRDLPTLLALQGQLPCLTHLAISLPSTAVSAWHSLLPRITQILESLPDLEVLFVQVARTSNGGGIDPTDSKIDDIRLVVFHAPMSVIAQWERTLTSNGGGLWKEAEKKVHERKATRKAGKRRKSSLEQAFARQTFAGLRGLTALHDRDESTFEDEDSD